MNHFLMSLAVMAALVMAPAANAQNAAAGTEGVRSIELLTGWRQASGTQMAAVKITLDPGWKTYWRAPGDLGIPPQFDWSGSLNLQTARIHWPRPTIMDVAGGLVIGYQNELILPIELTPLEKGDNIDIRARIDLGVCLDICIPVTMHLKSTVGVTGSNGKNEIKAALRARPVSAKSGKVSNVNCRLQPIADGFRITANLSVAPLAKSEVVVFELGAPDVWISQSKVTRSGRNLTAVAELQNYGSGALAIDRSAIRITLVGDANAVDIQGCPAG